MNKKNPNQQASSYQDRIDDEVTHWKKHADKAINIWNWEGPIGSARLRRRADYLRSFLRPGAKGLEVGCGTGLFTKELVRSGSDLVSIDISPDLLRIAKEYVPAARFLVRDACQTGFADETFDAVVGSSILHHLDVPAALKEFYRILKPGGTIAFTEPNMMNPHIFIQDKVPFIRKSMGVTKYETAFVRWSLAGFLEKNTAFKKAAITPFDFLYPFLPNAWLDFLEATGRVLEKTPGIREFAGSLQISAVK